MATRLGTVNPRSFPDEPFDYHSIPAFDTGQAELVLGREIGSAKQILQPGDVLLSRIVPHIRRAWIVGTSKGHRIIGSGEWIVFRSKAVYPPFLRHLLTSDSFHPQFMATVSGVGGSLLRARPSNVAKIKVSLPTFEEQRRIAAILDQAEALRAKRRQALAKLDTLTKSLFFKLLGELPMKPNKWGTKRLEELCMAITDIDHKMPIAVEDGMPFISAKDLLDDGTMSFENVKKISCEDFDRLARKSRPRRGDIIYSRIGVNLGKARLVEVDFDFLASYSCCTIKPRHELVNGKFLCMFLDSPLALRQAKKGIKAIAVPDLGLHEIKSFRVPVPPMHIQEAFVQQLDSLSTLRDSYRASAFSLTKSFAVLQHRAFRGEL